jgi:hypothetical protein
VGNRTGDTGYAHEDEDALYVTFPTLEYRAIKFLRFRAATIAEILETVRTTCLFQGRPAHTDEDPPSIS